ncbi:uncharacterized protein LOC110024396 isoform X2 [Phalaenopsis equestris]|uniref:uncharacterized protein LOC110024396 isoform X2 n=1 Tax=Phalaenopsis equestris TaxID=78828 RepID=UPI0009E2771B|nr:uncharacterized protein LOC110024396 isoform X2 [Phalaenopsis equestris]
MANSATGRFLHIYQGIESHFFPVAVLSRAKKSYGSSGPVRYIPGRFAQIENTQSCKSLQGSANKEEPISGNPTSGLANFDGRRLPNSLFHDETSSQNNIFEQIGGCSGIEESNGPVRGLYDSDYENKDELNKISKVNGDGFRKTREEIEEVAVGLLAARAMTAIELRKKLRGKKYPSDIIEFVVSDFKSRGLLNDSIYAESFTRSRWLSSTWGPRRIRLYFRKVWAKLKQREQ